MAAIGERERVGLRLAVHAALADPARLRIVDALALSDRSPRELQNQLEMPSNLLAHHLKVLEGARIIWRSRSRGDRRRNYIRLTPHSARHAHPVLSTPIARVLFVSTGGASRGPLAAAVWRTRSSIPVFSAGTVPANAVGGDAVRVAERHHLRFTREAPLHIEAAARATDLIISVCDSAHEYLADSDSLHWSLPPLKPEDTEVDHSQLIASMEARIDRLLEFVSRHRP